MASNWRRLVDPIQAGVEAATDAATLGLGDYYEAAKLASYGLGEGRTWGERYNSLRQMQAAEDEYGREHHPAARAVGGTVGTVGSVMLTGGASAPVRAIPYVSRAVGTGGRMLMAHVGPHAAVAGAGAVAGVAGQYASDYNDLRWGGKVDLGDYVDAGVGGGVGGLVTTYKGPRAGAMAEAYAAEGMRGLRTGEFSQERAQQNAVLGGIAGRVGDRLAQNWVDGLHFKQKGDLGELMSDIKTYVSGQEPVAWRKGYKTSRGTTIVDSVTDADLLIESKFGPKARLSRNQQAAQNQYGNYRVDWWDKSHVGKAGGGLSGLLFGQGALEDDR